MSAPVHRLRQHAELVPEHLRARAFTTPPLPVEAHLPETQDFAQRSG
jgi:hypothetical protein